MKVLFLFQSLPHYYNHVLSRLNAIPGMEIVDVVPRTVSAHVGEGVFQTREGANFRIVELDEVETEHGQIFDGVESLLRDERPEIVVAVRNVLEGIMDTPRIPRLMRRLGIKLILKDHPFQLPPAEEYLAQLEAEDAKKHALEGAESILHPLFAHRPFRRERPDRERLLDYRAASRLQSERRHDDARRIFRRLADPNSKADDALKAGACWHLAEIADLRGETEKAQQLRRRAFVLNPSHGAAFRNMHPRLCSLFEAIAARRRLTIRRNKVDRRKRLFALPDAHVHYVESGRDILMSYGVPAERIFVTYNSPDTDLLHDARATIERSGEVEKKPQRIIHVGRLVEWKRVDMLIDATARLAGIFPEIELVVVGYGPEEEKLRRRAAERGVAERVVFRGGVYDPAELGRLFLSSAVYVLAGMGGISINEAMCFGLPVICSVCDGTEKHLVADGENGLYFKEGDLDSLIETITLLLKDTAMRERMGRASDAIIRERINIRTVIDGYLRAFKYVLS